MEKDYRTIKQRARDELIEKKSRFIATVRPVCTEEEALALISEMKKEFSDASHNVYAYIIRKNNIARYSDDGEPGGTAGMPVMEVLKQEELTDVAVVVTRYFGGTLLGAGGLVRAYSKSAKLGIVAGGISVMTYCALQSVTVSYELYGKLRHMLEQEEVILEDALFGENVTVSFSVRANLYDSICKKITETVNGKCSFSTVNYEYKLIEVS